MTRRTACCRVRSGLRTFFRLSVLALAEQHVEVRVPAQLVAGPLQAASSSPNSAICIDPGGLATRRRERPVAVLGWARESHGPLREFHPRFSPIRNPD